jgi:hypothetical protein
MTQEEEKTYSYEVNSKDPLILISNRKTRTPPIYSNFITINNTALMELLITINPSTLRIFIVIVCSLLKMEKNNRIENMFNLNQTELALEIGISRSQMARAIKELIENNCIKKIEKTLYMVNPNLGYRGFKKYFQGTRIKYSQLKLL